jgi:hypothetical protein
VRVNVLLKPHENFQEVAIIMIIKNCDVSKAVLDTAASVASA